MNIPFHFGFRFIYGWSNLGNTLVAQGQLGEADESYSKAISLCEESLAQSEGSFGTKKCDDLYLILLNRGSVRLNNDMPKEALADLQKANTIRGRPDAVILQNLVRDRCGHLGLLLSDLVGLIAICLIGPCPGAELVLHAV